MAKKKEVKKKAISSTDNLYYTRLGFKNLVLQSIDDVFQQIGGGYSSKENVHSYYFDENALQTNFENKNENRLYIELKGFDIDNKSFILPNITIGDFSNKVLNSLATRCNTDTLLSLTGNVIRIRYVEQMDLEENIDESKSNQDNTFFYDFVVYIGVSYKTDTGHYGFKYYAKNRGESGYTLFPNQCIDNFVYKNYLTNNHYQEMINYFKEIILNHNKNKEIKFLLVETILYNVPNSIYLSKDKQIIMRDIINYTRNFSFQDYVSIDEQDKAFISKDSNLEVIDCRYVMRIIEEFYKENMSVAK